MATYQIVPWEDGFRVIETFSDGCQNVFDGFASAWDAEQWTRSLWDHLDALAGAPKLPVRTFSALKSN